MKSSRVFIIAEAGVNHNGSLRMAKRLVDAAAAAAADAVKFQTFRADTLVTRTAPKAPYQNKTDKKSRSQWEMIKRLELGEAAHRALRSYCSKKRIEFLSTPFDEESLKMLLGLGVRRIKIPSGEITNAPLLMRAGRTRKPIILSTGMSTLKEVRQALSVLAFALSKNAEKPGATAFARAFASGRGQALLKKYVTLLHCTTAYPAPFSEINLRAMDTLASRFGLAAGLSDHSRGFAVALAAAARGARVLEKHFTLDRRLKGPDHAASLEPDELKAMVEGIRQVEQALGSPEKKPTPSEKANKPVARKSLVALRPIRKGEAFHSGNVTSKRPGGGLSPMRYWEILEKKSRGRFQKDELLRI